jgi:monoamine oxidase
VAYWPQHRGRSRFDALAAALRAPHGRVLIGGDSTDSSHSDGAVRAGLRMAAQIAGTADAAYAGANASIMAGTSSPSG